MNFGGNGHGEPGERAVHPDDVLVRRGEMQTHVMTQVQPVRAEVLAMSDRVTTAVAGVHTMTGNLQDQITALAGQGQKNHELVMRLLKEALKPKTKPRKRRKSR